MRLDRNALLALWKLDEMPACQTGLNLAYAFLESCGEGVSRLGVEDSADRMTELTINYLAMVEHVGECEDCVAKWHA